ncbi:hypothetical protein TNCV_980701 [Trichonephila clavipes]|uniref:Uncharacterized protein n=1 Tax=Trichonephila clavipes TaxID=2585209 RepID=A0A8X6VEE1_TRICX|nr:hypothetical protein TNCV_980701 [Trichonephila clavipes]
MLGSQQCLTNKSPETILNFASKLDSEAGSKKRKPADAFSALEIAMEWWKKPSECCPTQLLLLKRIRDLAAKKWKVYNGAAKNK